MPRRPRERRSPPGAGEPAGALPGAVPDSGWPGPLGIGLALAGYATLHLSALGSAPRGISNDAAEEALRGLILVSERRLEAITTVLGNSAETLYLYLAGLLGTTLGTSWLALALPSIAAATALLGLLVLLSRRLDPRTPAWVPLGLGTASVWLFHYGQTGLRAVTAPVFLAATALLVDRSEESPRAAAGCGAVAGLAVYAYTSCRVLPIALFLHFGLRLALERRARRAVVRALLLAAGGLTLVSVPNLLTLAAHPREFLARGAYVLPPSAAVGARNLAATALLPFRYPDRYRTPVSEDHFFDGVSATLTGAGLDPVDLPTGLAFLAGLVLVRSLRRPLAAFLVLSLGSAVVLLGSSGPSLTRLLLVLPVYLAFASAAWTAFAARSAVAARVGAVALVALVAVRARAYATAVPGSEAERLYLSPAVTAVGREARTLVREGRRVLCVVTNGRSTVRYLAAPPGTTAPVVVVEFWGRPPNPAEIPVSEFRPDVLLIERDPRFAGLAERLGRAARTDRREHFDVVTVR